MNAYIGSRNEWDPLEEVVIGRIDSAGYRCERVALGGVSGC